MIGLFEMKYFLLVLVMNVVCFAPEEPVENQENVPPIFVLPPDRQDLENGQNVEGLGAPLPVAVGGRRFF